MANPAWTFRSLDTAYNDIFVHPIFHNESHRLLRAQHKSEGVDNDIIWSEPKIKALSPVIGLTGYAELHQHVRLGAMSIYGKTLIGQSVRADVAFCPYFMWRFPEGFGREKCFQVWQQIKSLARVIQSPYENGNTNAVKLEDLVYYVQYVEREDARRFDFEKKHPHLRMFFASKSDMRLGHSWLDQYREEKDEERWINVCGLPRFKIYLFETNIKPIYLWNRHHYNHNAWLHLPSDKYKFFDEDVRMRTTTCRAYCFVAHPHSLTWLKDCIDLPEIVAEVWDLETQGLEADKPDFRILTSSSIFLKLGGNKEPQVLSIECVTWQESNSIDNTEIHAENSESEALMKINQRRRENDVDFLITHNGVAFDMANYAIRCDKLGLKECRAMGKDLRERSLKRNGQSTSVSHAGISNIDILVFYKTYFSDIKMKKLKSLLTHFFDNEENPKMREYLDKEKHSKEHKDLLIRQLCHLLPSHFLINSKQDVHFSRIAPMFFSHDAQQVKELLEYNITDVFQTLRLALTHNILFSSMAFATVFENPIQVLFTQGTEIRAMSRIWREIEAAGQMYNVYDHPQDDTKLYSEPADGALVKEPVPGFYEDPALIDVASMYPSMILEFFLCLSTMVEHRFLSPNMLERLNKEWDYREYTYQGRVVLCVDGSKAKAVQDRRIPYFVGLQRSLKAERAKWKLAAKNHKSSGNTVMEQLCQSYEKGIKVIMNSCYGLTIQQGTSIPAIMDLKNESLGDIELRLATYERVAKEFKNRNATLDERQCYKLYSAAAETVAKIKKLFSRLTEHGMNEIKELHHTELQIRNEILNHRAHGGYFPMWCVGAGITYLGRTYITQTQHLITTHFAPSETVYGDTDSLMISVRNIPKRETFPSEHAFEEAVYHKVEEMVEFINNYWKNNACKRGCLSIELETIFRVMVIGKCKKYYFGRKLNISKQTDPDTGQLIIKIEKADLKISGLEMKKRDKCRYLRTIQTMIVNLVSERKINEALEQTKGMIQALVKGKVAIEELIMVQVLSSDPREMVNLTVGGSVALANEKEGRGVAQAKEEISFVFVRHPTKKNKECNTNELVMNANKAKETSAPLNYEYYVENHIRNPVCKLLESVVPDISNLFNSWVCCTTNHNLKGMFAAMQKKRDASQNDLDSAVKKAKF